jgi:hypothetical protein
MTKRLFIFLLLLSTATYGQKKSSKSSKKVDPMKAFSLDFYYGNTIYNNSFYNQNNTLNKINFTLPTRQIGIGFSDYYIAINPRINTLTQISYNYFFPEKILINDTLRSSMSGFSYSFGLGKLFFRTLKHFRLNVYCGFIAGRNKLITEGNVNFKNPFFSPKVLLQPKFLFGRIALSIIFNYNYDISSTTWSKINTTSSDIKINRFNQTNYNLTFSIGYRPF